MPAERVFAVIPAFRASRTLRGVVDRALEVVDEVIVVDDACPEQCGATLDGMPPERVHVLRHDHNGGVGAATKTGMRDALTRGADVIVKIDSDGQMDTAYVPSMLEFLRSRPEIDLVKGNRFADPATIQRMPMVRLIGNAALTFLVKFSTGYWTIVDPTNGFIAVRSRAVRESNLAELEDRYFFEIDLLCAFGLHRRPIAEMEMPAIYGDEPSSLSISNVIQTFPSKLLARFLRRVLVNYLVVEINPGTLCAAIGFPLLVAAIIFGGHEWQIAIQTQQPRPTGTIILALLLFTIGIQLSLQAFLYDVQFATRTVKVRSDVVRAPVEQSLSAKSRDYNKDRCVACGAKIAGTYCWHCGKSTREVQDGGTAAREPTTPLGDLQAVATYLLKRRATIVRLSLACLGGIAAMTFPIIAIILCAAIFFWMARRYSWAPVPANDRFEAPLEDSLTEQSGV